MARPGGGATTSGPKDAAGVAPAELPVRPVVLVATAIRLLLLPLVAMPLNVAFAAWGVLPSDEPMLMLVLHHDGRALSQTLVAV